MLMVLGGISKHSNLNLKPEHLPMAFLGWRKHQSSILRTWILGFPELGFFMWHLDMGWAIWYPATNAEVLKRSLEGGGI